jgi:hypothetical protein
MYFDDAVKEFSSERKGHGYAGTESRVKSWIAGMSTAAMEACWW